MKLDNDCIRDTLFALEDCLKIDDTLTYCAASIDSLMMNTNIISRYDKPTVIYTVDKLNEAGLINAEIHKAWGSTVTDVLIFDITYNGHEFIETFRSKTTWEKTKERAKSIGSASLPVLAEIAKQLILSQISTPNP